MKLLKRIILTFVFLVILLFVSVAMISWLYKDKLVEKGVDIVNRQIEGEFSISDASLSIFRSFPDLHLRMFDPLLLSDSDTLLSANTVSVSLSLSALWKQDEPLSLKEFSLDRPSVNLLVSADGIPNYDILRSASTDQEKGGESDLKIELKEVRIEDGNLSFTDNTSDLQLSIQNLYHAGNGDFASNRFDYESKSSAGDIFVKQNGIIYMDHVSTILEAIVDLDLEQHIYKLKENKLQINELELVLRGFLGVKDDNYEMDMRFEAPDTDLRQFISLLPGAYTEDFADIQTDGTFSLSGTIEGLYSPEGEYPAMEIQCALDNGSLKYPSFRESIQGIKAGILLEKEQGSLDKLVVSARDLQFSVAGNLMNASLDARDLISDPKIAGFVKGSLDLGSLRNAFPLEAYGITGGLVAVDMEGDFLLSDVQKERFEKIKLKGSLDASDVVYQGEGYQELSIAKCSMQLTPRQLEVKANGMVSGPSSLGLSGRVQSPLKLLSMNENVNSDWVLTASTIDLNSFMEGSDGANELDKGSTSIPDTGLDTDNPYVHLIRAVVDADIQKILYGDYELKGVKGVVTYDSDRLEIDHLRAQWDGESVRLSGYLEPVSGYALQGKTLNGELDFHTSGLDLNQWMEEEGQIDAEGTKADSGTNPEPARIPEDLSINVRTKADKLLYDNLLVSSISGELSMRDGRLEMRDMTGKAMGGIVKMEGVYMVEDDKPYVEMKTELDQLSFHKTYEQLNTFRALAPIAEFIDGTFQSRLAYSSRLQGDYFPELSSINMDGFLQTFDAVLRNFKPFEKIGEFLQMDNFKALPIQSSKNWFSVDNGIVTIEPFEMEVEDVKLLISGTYNLDRNIHFNVKADVPESYLEKLNLNKFLEKGRQTFNEQAARLGLSLRSGQSLQFDLNLRGTIKDPTMKVALTGSGQKSMKETVVKGVKGEVKQAKDSLVGTVSKKSKDLIDTLKTDAKKQATELVKDQLGQLTGTKKDTASAPSSEVGKKAEDAVEKAKEKLKNFDPFKKKKKKGDQ